MRQPNGEIDMPKTVAALTDECEQLRLQLSAQINATTSARNEAAGLREELASARDHWKLRTEEVDRLTKTTADYSAMLREQGKELDSLRQNSRVDRRSIDDLKSRLMQSEHRVTRLEGTLERVREGDRLRLVAMGRLPAEPPGRTMADVVSGINQQRDDVDWVTF
jgi:chromosome segregation ATPase